MKPVRCASCGQPARWLVTIPYSDGKAGRILAYSDECRNRDMPILISISLERVDEELFVELYRLGYTESSWRSMQPDFIVFSRNHRGTPEASIVDPHGAHLADAIPKLKGLARLAETYGDRFARSGAIGDR